VEAVILFPAIDLKDGLAVRLQQGDPARATVFNRDPAEQARTFAAQGFEYLHIVDLDGAFAGRPMNAAAVERILAAVEIPLQLGGGIRDRATIDAWLGKGVARVIIGTAAVRDPALVKEAARAHPGRVAVGLDARDGKVAVEGWAETSELSALDLAKRFEDAGVAAIVYTDIARDGMLKGLNLDATIALANEISIPVIASGGLASLDDLRVLLGDYKINTVAHYTGKIAGAIAGRALYDGRLDAAEALNLIRAAATDALTGLLTRRGFAARKQLIAARMKNGDRYSAIVFDIDGFIHFNDVHNHMVGDAVLQRIGATLLAESAVAVRTGGDEFALLLSGPAAVHAQEIAERYLRDFAAMRIGETPAKMVCSFGVSSWKSGDTIESMMARAAAALDVAKHEGGGRVVVAEGLAQGAVAS
jgi:phosphoribosylformimino-5-aminoimidazole carboxamide ribotide isomerase